MRRKIGTILMILGGVMLLAAGTLLFYNQWEDGVAEDAARETLIALEENIETRRNDVTEEIPEQKWVESVMIDGEEYIGYLSIPRFGLELPIMAQWSYEGMKTAPGRYSGTASTNDFVVAGHNYARHFGKLKDIEIGDAVTFTDVNGIVYAYEVAEVTTLEPTAIAEMVGGGWDCSLFTCNYSGNARVTVRCSRVENTEE